MQVKWVDASWLCIMWDLCRLNSLVTLRISLKCSFLNWVTHVFRGFNQQVCTSSGNFSPRLQATFPSLLFIHSKREYQAHFEPPTLPSSNHPTAVLPMVAMPFSGIILFLLLRCFSFLSLSGTLTLQTLAAPVSDSEALCSCRVAFSPYFSDTILTLHRNFVYYWNWAPGTVANNTLSANIYLVFSLC